jgi:AraC-like DNA-binding protein
VKHLLPKLALGGNIAQLLGGSDDFQATLWPGEAKCSLSFDDRQGCGCARVSQVTVGSAVVSAVASTPYVEVAPAHDWTVLWMPVNGLVRLSTCAGSFQMLGGKGALLLDGGDWTAEAGLCSYVRILLPRDLVDTLYQIASEASGSEVKRPLGAGVRLLDVDPLLMGEFLCALSIAFRLTERRHASRFLNLELLIVRFIALLMGEAAHIETDEIGLINSAGEDRLQLIVDAVRADLSAPLSLSDMELLSGLSRRSVQYMFNKRYGSSPIAWQLLERLTGAYSAITDPKDRRSITQVAYDFGFASSSTFSVYFRRQFGVSPSELR